MVGQMESTSLPEELYSKSLKLLKIDLSSSSTATSKRRLSLETCFSKLNIYTGNWEFGEISDSNTIVAASFHRFAKASSISF
jgi:hypothetical protein